MDAVVTAIRNALEKGNAYDRAFRERVYRSAFAALERSIAAKPDLAPEEARQQRENLQAKVADIESEFVPAVAPDISGPATNAPPSAAPGTREEEADGSAEASAVADVPRSDPPVAPAGAREAGDTPRIDRDEAFASGESAPALGAVGERGWRDEGRGRSRLALMFLFGTFVVGAIIGGWWLLQSGIPTPATEREAGASNPPLASGEEFAGDEEESARPTPESVVVEGNWLSVFSPSDPTSVNAPGGTGAEVVEEEDQRFLRIHSETAGAAVGFDVGQGILEELAGGRAVFSIVARGQEDQETEIAITCDFGGFGDCTRTRYVVGIAPSEYLFEIDLPDRSPGAGGTMTIAPDITGQGRTLDVFAIRASAAN